jgi:hypothetical protein
MDEKISKDNEDPSSSMSAVFLCILIKNGTVIPSTMRTNGMQADATRVTKTLWRKATT